MSFTSIRFVWAFSILLCHIYLSYDDVINFGIFNFLRHGGFGVTHFFMLSGFLVFMHHGEDYDCGCKIIDGFKYAFFRIRKWYLLHIITMIIGICINLGTAHLIYKVLINILLIQVWKPPYNYSLNGVAWYLSCLFALYLITPKLLYFNRVIRKNKIICIFFLVILAVLNFIMGNTLSGAFYFHPIYRSIQYISGGGVI